MIHPDDNVQYAFEKIALKRSTIDKAFKKAKKSGERLFRAGHDQEGLRRVRQAMLFQHPNATSFNPGALPHSFALSRGLPGRPPMGASARSTKRAEGRLREYDMWRKGKGKRV